MSIEGILVRTGLLAAAGLLLLSTAQATHDEWPYYYHGSASSGTDPNNEKWCSDPTVYNGVGSAYYYRQATEVALSLWTSAPYARFMTFTTDSANANVKIITYSSAETTSMAYGGINQWDYSQTPYCFSKGEIGYNTFWPPGSRQRMVYRAHQEFGHVLNLAHWPDDTEVMYHPSSAAADNKGIFHPTYRSIEALRALYGYESQTFGSRSVLGDAGAGPSGSFPSRIWTGTSSGKHYAMAYNAHSMFSFQKGMMVTAIVQGTTLHRFGVGFFAGTDPTDQTKRMSIIEIDNDGIKSVVTDTVGGSRIAVLQSNAESWTDYFVQAVMPRMGDSNTYWSTNCAWRVSDGAFLGCGASQTSEMGYGNPPATAYGAMAAWTESGAANSYWPARGSSQVW